MIKCINVHCDPLRQPQTHTPSSYLLQTPHLAFSNVCPDSYIKMGS